MPIGQKESMLIPLLIYVLANSENINKQIEWATNEFSLAGLGNIRQYLYNCVQRMEKEKYAEKVVRYGYKWKNIIQLIV